MGDGQVHSLTKLTPEEERRFQLWYNGWARKTKIDPNPDDPRHFYDYRGAFRAGATPSMDPEDNRYHWPSAFKREGHPRLILDGMDTRTGLPSATASVQLKRGLR